MRYFFIVAIFLLFPSKPASAQSKSNGKLVIKTELACDHCKQCPSCGKRIGKGLLAIDGVKMYEIDEKAETITVFYNPKKTSEDAIRSGISKLGFKADDIPADAEAVARLDGCCRGKE